MKNYIDYLKDRRKEIEENMKAFMGQMNNLKITIQTNAKEQTEALAIAKKAGIARRTLYDMLDPNKKFNPELSTVSAVIRALAA